jgi:hypothetical protein
MTKTQCYLWWTIVRFPWICEAFTFIPFTFSIGNVGAKGHVWKVGYHSFMIIIFLLGQFLLFGDKRKSSKMPTKDFLWKECTKIAKFQGVFF